MHAIYDCYIARGAYDRNVYQFCARASSKLTCFQVSIYPVTYVYQARFEDFILGGIQIINFFWRN